MNGVLAVRAVDMLMYLEKPYFYWLIGVIYRPLRTARLIDREDARQKNEL